MKTLIALHLSTSIVFGATTYPIVDTGQIKNYGSNVGQDAQYSINAPAYEDHGNGTVSDLVTGLMWTQDPGKKITFTDAEKGAPNCTAGGHTDWRLPSIKELYSLIQLNGTDPDPMSTNTTGLKPFLDEQFFKFTYGKEEDGDRIIDAQYASSTPYVSTTMDGNETLLYRQRAGWDHGSIRVNSM